MFSDNIEDESFGKTELQLTDPLKGLGSDISEPVLHRVNEIIFAEPLKTIQKEKKTSDDNIEETKEDIMVIDNVVVQKNSGRKYKKYVFNIEQGNLNCSLTGCTKKFSSTKLLKAHIRKTHCADRSRYICDQCGTGFAAHYLLVRHAAVHGDGVQCAVCNKTLSRRTNLAAHLRLHKGLRPHGCSICQKTFARSSALRKHMNTHWKKFGADTSGE